MGAEGTPSGKTRACGNAGGGGLQAFSKMQVGAARPEGA